MTDPPVSNSSGTSSGLLERARLKQAEAWDKLVRLYGPLVYRWCRRWGLQPKDAENAGQEVFLRVFNGLRAFRGQSGEGSFRSWLLRITHNCCRDHFRHRFDAPQAQGGNEALQQLQQIPAVEKREADSDLATADQTWLFERAVEFIRGEFTERDWLVFSQVVMHGRRPADVGTEMNMSVNSVYLVRSRVLRRLREEFAEMIDI